MPKFRIAVFLLFVVTKAASQQPIFQWARAFVAENQYNPSVYSNGRSIAVDQQGNVYSAGLFNFTTDFDPGNGVFTLSTTNWANTGIYISKLSATGDFIWAIQVPALVEFGNIEIRVDRDDNVYLVSELRDPTDFDPGPGVYMLTPIGAMDAFVAKYDPNGNLVWAKQFGGPGDTVQRSDVLDIDNNNNVIVCGNFNNTVDFEPGPNTFNITSTAHIQSFIVKLNSKGDFIWAKQFGNSPVVYSGSNIADVKCDPQGNIYTVGNFAGTCDFDPDSGNYSLQATCLRDGYIAKLDPGGQLLWAKRIGNTENDYYEFADSRGIDIDSDNNVYTTGNFTGTFDFDPGDNTHILTSNNYDWYVLKLSAQGDFVWTDVLGGDDIEIGADIAVDNAGNVYATGTVGENTDMDPGPGVYIINSVGKYDIGAIVKLNSHGGFLSAGLFDGEGSVLPRRVVVDNSQNIYITGHIFGTTDFDLGPNIALLNGGSTEAPYVVKYGKCKHVTTSTLNISSCSSYTLNNEIFDSSGTYTRTLMNSEGCDSVITLHLIINKKYTKQDIAICEGESFFAGGALQTIPGIYKDTLSTSLHCDSIVTTHLTVHPKPSPNLGPDQDLCTGTEYVISPGSFAQYQWQDMTTSSNLKVTSPGLYWVKVTNTFNCSAADSFIVHTILPSPAHFLKKKDSICSYEKLEIRSSQAYNKYLWSTGSDESKIVIDKPGPYWLTATDINGCTGTEKITVFEKECMYGVYIPTAFTPNNDGKNDIFKALVFGKVQSFRLQVFDRAGQLIFQTNNPGKGWDGLSKGMGYSTSTFVWQCFYQLDQQKPGYQKGTVTIIR